MRVVQLVAISGTDRWGEQVYALCDDGSIWTATATAAQDHEWHRVNPPPGCEVQVD